MLAGDCPSRPSCHPNCAQSGPLSRAGVHRLRSRGQARPMGHMGGAPEMDEVFGLPGKQARERVAQLQTITCPRHSHHDQKRGTCDVAEGRQRANRAGVNCQTHHARESKLGTTHNAHQSPSK